MNIYLVTFFKIYEGTLFSWCALFSDFITPFRNPLDFQVVISIVLVDFK